MITDAMRDYLMNGTGSRPTMVDGRVTEFINGTLASNDAITEEKFFELIGNDEKAKNLEKISTITEFYSVRNAIINHFGAPSTGTTPPLAQQAAAATVAASPEAGGLAAGFGGIAPAAEAAPAAGLAAGFGGIAPAAETPAPAVQAEVVAEVPAEAPARRPVARSRAEAIAGATAPTSEAPAIDVTATTVETPAPEEVAPSAEAPATPDVPAEQAPVEAAPAADAVSAAFGGVTLPVTDPVAMVQELAPDAVTSPATAEAAGEGSAEAQAETKKRRAARTKAAPAEASEVHLLLEQALEVLKQKDKELAELTAQIAKLQAELDGAKTATPQVVLPSKILKGLAAYGIGTGTNEPDQAE